jgi:hypothetical protein
MQFGGQNVALRASHRFYIGSKEQRIVPDEVGALRHYCQLGRLPNNLFLRHAAPAHSE